MLDRTWGGSFRLRQDGRTLESRKPSRVARRPQVELLEGRQLLTASIQPIAPVSVPSGLGYQVEVDAGSTNPKSQTFTVTSSNPDFKATVAKGAFVTVNVSHAASTTPGDISFNGSYTYQLLQDLAPNTASRIQTFTNAGGFNGTTIFRVVSGFGGTTSTVFQGGPQPGSGTNPLELNQKLSFVNPGSVAIANAGPNTDGTEFFVTTGPVTQLNFGFTIFGQIVGDTTIVNDIAAVTTHNTTPPTGQTPEKSVPDSPININSETVSSTNPNGVITIDATGAAPGETSTITVTATDPSGGAPATTTFTVTAVANTNPTTTNLILKPTAFPITKSIIGTTATTIQLGAGSNNNIPTGTPGAPTITTKLAILSQPAHGKLSNFNATKNTVVYTPDAGFTGIDTFTYQATNTATPASGSPTVVPGNVATVTISDVPKAPVDTKAVRVIGNVLVVTPPPTPLPSSNTILVSQVNNPTTPASDKLTVTLNGNTDLIQPVVSSIKQIVVYGSKSSDQITIDPSVAKTINVSLDGGHGGKNVLQAAAGSTREHGWFGQNTLIGGTGPNQLIGAKGHVTFKPTTTTNEIFAGEPHPGYFNFRLYHGRLGYQLHPPGGTFYTVVKGKALPIPTPKQSPARS